MYPLVAKWTKATLLLREDRGFKSLQASGLGRQNMGATGSNPVPLSFLDERCLRHPDIILGTGALKLIHAECFLYIMSPKDNDKTKDLSEDKSKTGSEIREVPEDVPEEEESELPQPEDDEGETNDESGSIPPSGGFTFSKSFIEKLEEATKVNINPLDYSRLSEVLEQHAETRKKMVRTAAALEFDQDQFQISISPKILGITEEANRALAESINPEIFRIHQGIEDAAATNLYETVAALNQLEQEGVTESEDRESETTSEHEEPNTPTAGEIFEEDVIDDVAEEVVENDEYPSELKERAHTIQETDSHEEKQVAFNAMYEIADEQSRKLLDFSVRFTVSAKLYLIVFYLYAKASLSPETSDG